MSVKERLTQYIKYKNITTSAFCKSINVSTAFVSSMRKSLQPDKLESIAFNFPDLNTGWLMTGEGEMLKTDDNSPIINYARHGVPYYDVDFLCGFDLIENDQTMNPGYYIDFKQYNKADFWMNASGDSMRPTISPGDILAIRQLPDADWIDHIMYGEVYAIVTTQNRTIKKVRKSSLGNDYLRLIPENLLEYDEQDVKINTILRVFQVLGCMKKLI